MPWHIEHLYKIPLVLIHFISLLFFDSQEIDHMRLAVVLNQDFEGNSLTPTNLSVFKCPPKISNISPQKDPNLESNLEPFQSWMCALNFPGSSWIFHWWVSCPWCSSDSYYSRESYQSSIHMTHCYRMDLRSSCLFF